MIGYYEVLEVILESYEDIELKELNIFNLYNFFLKFSGKDGFYWGKYKRIFNKVVVIYLGGE